MAAPSLHTPNVDVTFYVDAANGDDSRSGASAQNPLTPWLTLNKAYTYLRDTHSWTADKDIRVYVRGGTYQAGTNNEATLKIGFTTAPRKPTSTQWVIWEAYPGETPVIREPSGTSSSTHKYSIKASTAGTDVADYQTFKGLTLYGGAARVNNTADVAGIYCSDNTAHVEIIDCHIYGFQAMDTDDGTPTSKAQGIFLDPNITDVKITRCTIHDIGTATGTINAQEHGIYCAGDTNYVWNNLVYRCVNGYGIQFFNGGDIAGIYCCHNTVVGPFEKSCIVVPGHAVDATVKNNVLVGATENGIQFFPTNQTGSGNVIDHIVYYNMGGLNKSHSSRTGWTITNETTADPLFRNAGGDDYHLGAGSPAIDYTDSGENPTVDLDGGARSGTPDTGAYEFSISGGYRALLGWGP